jgi:hypothetical protein
MQKRILSLPTSIVVTGTRVALGFGLGLWLSGKFRRNARTSSANGLFAVNVINTFPITVINTFPITVTNSLPVVINNGPRNGSQVKDPSGESSTDDAAR